MEGYKCHVSNHGVANILIDRILRDHDWLSKNFDKATGDKLDWYNNDLREARKLLINMIPDNDKEEEQ